MAGSGYNQDSNQITPGMYRVVLTMNTTNYPTGSNATNNGGVNPYDWNNGAYTTVPSSTANAVNLARGNLRWQAILEQLYLAGDCRIENISVTSSNTADSNQQPTALSFTVSYDRDAFILPEVTKYLVAGGSSANGTYTNSDSFTGTAYNSLNATTTPVNTPAVAIQELVTNAIVRGGASAGYTRQYRVYNLPTASDSMQATTIVQPCVPATAFTTVSVTQISGTTLAGTPV
jgi:hypothetical protein